jgi:DNA-binding CsgD family transcriptional regulator
MDEKLAKQLEDHRAQKEARRKKQEAKAEDKRIRQMRVLGIDNKRLAMMLEAQELRALTTIANNMRAMTSEESPQAKHLADTAKRLRSIAITRWSLDGQTNSDISEAFGISAMRVSQIKREILELALQNKNEPIP